MARAKKFRWGASGVALLVVLAGLGLWMAPSRQTSSAQDNGQPNGSLLISRGYTDAPAGTAVIAGDPAGGSTILELRIKDGEKVKRDEVIAVLSNYPRADVSVRTAEANLEKVKQQREAMVTGSRVTQIAMQEAAITTTIEQNKLKALELQRSAKPIDQKDLELSLAQQGLDRQKATLALQRQSLAADLAMNELDLKNAKSSLDTALASREEALVRSPLEGVVVQIFARQGERIGSAGIAKIVDMRQLRVLADVDELHVGRVAQGGKVEVTFRGSPTVYKGTISRVAPTVKRMQRVEPDGGTSTDARVVQVEIEIDDPSSMPQVLGRETRVTFL
jgi:multidrug resistance efflux pump